MGEDFAKYHSFEKQQMKIPFVLVTWGRIFRHFV